MQRVNTDFFLQDHQSIAVIRNDIYRSPAMVTVAIFLVSLFVSAERVCVFSNACMCSEFIREGEPLCHG